MHAQIGCSFRDELGVAAIAVAVGGVVGSFGHSCLLFQRRSDCRFYAFGMGIGEAAGTSCLPANQALRKRVLKTFALVRRRHLAFRVANLTTGLFLVVDLDSQLTPPMKGMVTSVDRFSYPGGR